MWTRYLRRKRLLTFGRQEVMEIDFLERGKMIEMKTTTPKMMKTKRN